MIHQRQSKINKSVSLVDRETNAIHAMLDADFLSSEGNVRVCEERHQENSSYDENINSTNYQNHNTLTEPDLVYSGDNIAKFHGNKFKVNK